MGKRAITVITALLITSCSTGDRDGVLTHREYADGLVRAGLAETKLAGSWQRAAAEALDKPMAIELPHRETGAFFPHETRAIGLAFDAVHGQRLELSLNLGPESTGRLFVQVFHVPSNDQPPSEVEAVNAEAGSTILLERDGRHVVRMQPELLATVVYDLQIELHSSLPFPVSGLDPQAVGSFFGDPRDAGRRRHEGVDIFAPRMAPLLAVADGVATTRTNSLGGNTVWLRTEGERFYYAHLEKAAFQGRQRVSTGEVLGYVGNSGNARSTPPHLHFGIYRSRRGAVDPLPYLRSYRYASVLEPEKFVSVHIRTTASRLNLRSWPAVEDGNVLGTLSLGTPGRTLARSGHWLRIRTVDGREGWIHDRYQRPLSSRDDAYVPAEPRLLFANPTAAAAAVGRVAPAMPLNVFAEHAGAILVGLQRNEPVGWLWPARDDQLM